MLVLGLMLRLVATVNTKYFISFHFTISGYPLEVNYEGKMKAKVTRLSLLFILVVVGMVACVMCACCHRIKRCIDMRGRATDARAPLFHNDELQSGHEWVEQEIPAHLPLENPLRPFQNTTGSPAVELHPAFIQLPESTKTKPRIQPKVV